MLNAMRGVAAVMALGVAVSAGEAQVINVPASASGGFGAPAFGQTDFVGAIPVVAGQVLTLEGSGLINAGAGPTVDANGVTLDRSIIEGPFPQGYLPLEETLLDAGTAYGDLPQTVEHVAALIGGFVPLAVALDPNFAPRDNDNVAAGIDSADLFFIGTGPTLYTAPADGLLYFGVNEGYVLNNSGGFTLGVSVPEPATLGLLGLAGLTLLRRR